MLYSSTAWHLHSPVYWHGNHVALLNLHQLLSHTCARVLAQVWTQGDMIYFVLYVVKANLYQEVRTSPTNHLEWFCRVLCPVVNSDL